MSRRRGGPPRSLLPGCDPAQLFRQLPLQILRGRVSPIKGFGVRGLRYCASDGLDREVEDAQSVVVHPGDRFDAVEGAAVRGGKRSEAS